MLEWLFNIRAENAVTDVAVGLRSPGGGVVALLAIAAAVAFATYLYRRERDLPRRRRLTLGVLRASLLALLAMVLLEPVLAIESAVAVRKSVLVLLDRSQSMAIEDVGDEARQRHRAAWDILAAGDGGLLQRLGETHRVRLFTFGEELESLAAEPAADPSPGTPDAAATRLGDALEEAMSRTRGQDLAAIVVLTDGASNRGIAPAEVARRVGAQGVAIFPIGLGRPDPPDVVLDRLIVPDTAFLGDRVAVRAHLRSTGFSGQAVEIVAKLDGQAVGRQTTSLTGGPQHVELALEPQTQAGVRRLEVSVTPLPAEASPSNNTLTQQLRILDEKIRVLFVEGAPRWEYRYLRHVLLRDHRLDTRFFMTQGDRELASQSTEFLATFPSRAEELFEYDLIILGDIPAQEFTQTQLQALEQLVRERGGSLLVLPGLHAGLLSYTGTPLERALPVELQASPPEPVVETAAPVLTPMGKSSGFMQIGADDAATESYWRLVQPMYHVPAIRAAKPGATVLATLPDMPRRREPYPLIAWHRYGSGKVLFIGTDQLWRLRFKRGDALHTRFWGEAIQFLTLSRLLGENKRIQVGVNGTEFSVGQRVPVYANVLSESYEPSRLPSYAVRIVPPGAAEQTVTLRPAGDAPGFFEGVYVPEQEGTHRVLPATEDESSGNAASFAARSVALEGLDPAMQIDQLEQLADLSGGEVLLPVQADRLPGLLEQDHRTSLVRQERELWEHPAVFLVLFGLMSAEWLLRRRSNLV